MNRLIHFVLVATTTTLYLCSNTLQSQTSAVTQISLTPHPADHDVPSGLKGVNQTANTNINNVNNQAFDDEFTAINPGTMRFPGGTFANSYDWQLKLNDSNTLNLKHTIALANQVGADINYVLNYGTTTPDEAAELVHILNDPSQYYQDLRLTYFNDTSTVGVKYWELGNELAAKWEWHVSWVAGGHDQYIFNRTDADSIHMPRSTTDYLHYFGGDIWREGWVYRWGDGMTVYNSILGTLHQTTSINESEGNAVIEVEFGPILNDEVKVWLVTDTSLSTINYNQMCDDAVNSPCREIQQALYDGITTPTNLLSASQYTISADGKTINVALTPPLSPLLENQLILVEYNTHHSGAFDIRDAMKNADPTIEIGYCIDFRQNLLNTPGFNDRLETSPPDFLIEHPYNKTTDLALNNGLLSEIMHIVDDKIIDEFISSEADLDDICSSLNIPEIGIALTEWNIRLCGDGNCNPAYNGILGGLYTANFLGQTYQAQANNNLDIRLSNHFAGVATGNNLIHMWHFNNNTLESTPQGEATRMVNEVIGENILLSSEINIEGNPINILTGMDENNDLFTYESEALKVFVSDDKENDTLMVLILNNDDELEHQVIFNTPCDRIGGDATLEILNGELDDSPYYINNSTIVATSDSYSFNVPSFSVTTLKIPYEPGPSCTCYADFVSDGSIGVLDLLELLADYGCLENCSKDLNADHNVGTADILIFLTFFGGACSE